MSLSRWAIQIFGNAELGDERRTSRLVEMTRQAALQPAGRVTQVFLNAAARQGAYDFLRHEEVSSTAVAETLFRSTVQACRNRPHVLIPLDGTSLSLVDEDHSKGFGSIGTATQGARGLKVINALALTPEGTMIGVADQIWWTRQELVGTSRSYRSKRVRESQHWRTSIQQINARFAAECPETTLHFIADREADATYTLQQMLQQGVEFTVRSNGTRKVASGNKRSRLRRVVAQLPSLGTLDVQLPATSKREARVARLEIRAASLPIIFKDHHEKTRRTIALTVVWAREQGRRTNSLDWILLTNRTATRSEAFATVRRYTMRWRIEDFHKTWKSGACNVEATQLRSPEAVIKWATILAAVASRIERLRRRCREEPDLPASEEFSTDELDAISLLRAEKASRVSAQRATALTILVVTRRVAELGGYVANRHSPPGATTISRGLERVAIVVEMLEHLRREGRLR